MRLLVEGCLLTSPINAHCSLISHAGNDSQANASNGDSTEDKISLPQLIYHLTPRKDIRLIVLMGMVWKRDQIVVMHIMHQRSIDLWLQTTNLLTVNKHQSPKTSSHVCAGLWKRAWPDMAISVCISSPPNVYPPCEHHKHSWELRTAL